MDPLSYGIRLGYNLREAQRARFPNRATHQCVETIGPTRLADEDYSFLLGPKEREINPFGQILGGEIRRLGPGPIISTIFGARNANRVNRLT